MGVLEPSALSNTQSMEWLETCNNLLVVKQVFQELVSANQVESLVESELLNFDLVLHAPNFTKITVSFLDIYFVYLPLEEPL